MLCLADERKWNLRPSYLNFVFDCKSLMRLQTLGALYAMLSWITTATMQGCVLLVASEHSGITPSETWYMVGAIEPDCVRSGKSRDCSSRKVLTIPRTTTPTGQLMSTCPPLRGLLLPLISPSRRPSGRRPSLRRVCARQRLLWLMRNTKKAIFKLHRLASTKESNLSHLLLNAPGHGTPVP